MILHPGILSLIIGSLIVLLMVIYSALLGIRILRRWDLSSSSSGQLSLERKTYLVSTIMNYAFAFVILSAILFIYTADDIHGLFIGAMCATGSLNANPVGWYVLYTKIATFFMASLWLALNHIDQKVEDYPLIKIKYIFILFMVPLLALDTYLQLRYFLGLSPNVITACCGSLFSEEGEGIASTLSALPVKPMMVIFYVTLSLFMANAILSIRSRRGIFKYTLAALSLILFLVSISSIISFISLYFYEMPTHHCPFDIIQREYNFIGYPVYITLFGGVLFGMITGILEPFKRIRSLSVIIERAQKRWVIASIVLILIFTILSTWPIVFSDFTLLNLSSPL